MLHRTSDLDMKKSGDLEDLGIDGRILLKWILQTREERVDWLHLD
jgi:hypothetical protein